MSHFTACNSVACYSIARNPRLVKKFIPRVCSIHERSPNVPLTTQRHSRGDVAPRTRCETRSDRSTGLTLRNQTTRRWGRPRLYEWDGAYWRAGTRIPGHCGRSGASSPNAALADLDRPTAHERSTVSLGYRPAHRGQLLACLKALKPSLARSDLCHEHWPSATKSPPRCLPSGISLGTLSPTMSPYRQPRRSYRLIGTCREASGAAREGDPLLTMG